MGRHMAKQCALVVVIVLAVAACAVGAPAGGVQRRKVSATDARQLVWEALPSHAQHLPKLSIEGGQDSAYPGFFVFSVMWAGTPNGSVMYGSYAVDESTGDVFDPVSECVEISTPALRKLQTRIRSRIGLSESDYRTLKGNGPMCADKKSPG